VEHTWRDILNTTNYESLLDFKFPELTTRKVVTRQAHVDDNTSSKEAAYNMMIMGIYLMKSIGITVDFEQRCIRSYGTETPLKTRNTLSDDGILHIMLNNATNETDILQEAEKTQNCILDADTTSKLR
jgi:hypothetical protein